MSQADKLCMGCMTPLPNGREACGICGYPADGENPPLYLPAGSLLSDRYLVGRVLDGAGDASVYIGYDRILKAPILIREFLPDSLCTREKNGAITIIAGCESAYEDYRERFRAHARALARLRELPSLIPLYDIFDQNGTVYTIGEFCEGVSLEERLSSMGGRLSWEEARPLFMTLMSTLISMHSAGICHYGLCPAHLIMASDGRLHMRGFSIVEARCAGTDLKPCLIDGYSAPEQYAAGEKAGAWSDVYGLAAVIFRTLTGNPPPAAPARVRDGGDLFVPADIAEKLPEHVAAALFNALQLNPEKRIRTMKELRDRLSEAPAISAMRGSGEDTVSGRKEVPAKTGTKKKKKKSGRGKYALLIVLCSFVMLLLVAGVVIVTLFPEVLGGGESSSSDPASLPTPTAPTVPTLQVPAAPQYAVDDVVGKNYFEIKDSTLAGSMKIKLQYLVFSDQPLGTVLDQTPSPEQSADEGSTVQVIVSAGPETVAVPDLRGWEEEKAKLYLEALGLRVSITELRTSDVERGLVQDTSPKAGTELKLGDNISLRVSYRDESAGGE
ncbi:MAG: PASTA domain-containing protein [Clostridiales bacterium]|nr:PASTA domain-containing protein [Clostridiales bacterium]